MFRPREIGSAGGQWRRSVKGFEQELPADGCRVLLLHPGSGAERVEHHPRRAALRRPGATAHLSGDDQRTQTPLGGIVGGRHCRIPHKGEEFRAVLPQPLRQGGIGQGWIKVSWTEQQNQSLTLLCPLLPRTDRLGRPALLWRWTGDACLRIDRKHSIDPGTVSVFAPWTPRSSSKFRTR